MNKFFGILLGLLLLTGTALSAPLTNGDFAAGGANWTDVAGSSNTFGGGLGTAVHFQVLNFGTATGAAMQNAVNAGGTALSSISGVGSMFFQAFDTTTGNAGRTILFDVSAFTNAVGVTNFAYFLDVDTATETLVNLNSVGAQTPFTYAGNSTNLLVGFGILDNRGAGAVSSLSVANINQVPEIDVNSATLPIAVTIFAFLLFGDARRRRQETFA